MFSTSAFAVMATDIFPSGIVAKTISGSGAIECTENGVPVDCSTVRTSLNEAPYKTIKWPNFKQESGDDVSVLDAETKTINPGVYENINVEAGGVLIMNPGVYWIESYNVNGQVLPGDDNGTKPEGTADLLVKSTLNLNGSYNNCNTDGTFYQHSNRYVLYTEDRKANVDDTCFSGYIYFKGALSLTQMRLQGAISAETIEVNGVLNVASDLDHLIFTDFGLFLEVGPNMLAGWHMVKAPAEINATNPVTVADFFGDDLNTSTFNTEWVVYQRDYDAATHKRYYTKLNDINMELEKNRGYWLGTTKDAELKVLGLNPIVWDRKMKAKDGCTTPRKGCYRYALQSCTEGDADTNLYNLVGSVGATDTYWGDYRVEVKDKLTGVVTVMHPDDAAKNNIMSNQIWTYNVGNNGYDIIGTSLLSPAIEYFDGFWVEMNCTNSIEKEINLIIPNGKAK